MPCDCSEFLDRLDLWIDGDLEASEGSRLQAHVEGCSGCREELRFAKEIRAEMGGMPEFDAPERVLAAVYEATKPTVGERLSSTLGWLTQRPLRAVVAVAAVAVLLFVVVPRGEGPGAHYTESEIRRATAETRLALAYVSSAARRAERGVRKKVLEEREFPATMREISRTLSWAGETGVAQPTVPASPTNTSKGS